jgi:hypothetical protein
MMSQQEMLLDCMSFYQIPVKEVRENHVYTIKAYEIEVESNGLFKLKQQDAVIAPFDDLDELCRFILNY